MTKYHHFLVMILSLTICINAAPSDLSKLEDIVKIENEDTEKTAPENLDEPATLTENINGDNSTQGQRQKRWYNFYGYGIPPMNPVIYPNYKRDESSETGTYGAEEPFNEIHRRLQEIASVVRQQVAPAPSPVQFPVFFPVIYIPLVGCACTPQDTAPPPSNKNNDSMVNIEDRFSEMEDPRQNWGFFENGTMNEINQDFNRPLSFEPIPPSNPMGRPPPPVDHGSVQASANDPNNVQGGTTTTTSTITTTTVRSSIIEGNIAPSFDTSEPPNVCDGAILSCCHQPVVTYNCFDSLGCPERISYGNPCEADVILKVVEKFHKFYGQKTG